MRLRILLAVAALLFLTENGFPRPAQDTPPATYEDSAAGLRQQMKDLAESFHSTDEQGRIALLQSLDFSDAPAWFRATFGEAVGAVLAREYAGDGAKRRAYLQRALGILGAKPGIKADLFDERCSEHADEARYPVLALRVSPANPLYQVRLNFKNWDSTLWFFAYAGGRFRYTGAFDFKQKELRPALTEAFRIQHGIEAVGPLGAGFEPPAVTHREPPKYPKEASKRFVEGQMEFFVVIRKDGTAGDVMAMNGHCWFVQAAAESVRRWKFHPARQNGQPIDSITLIQFDFGFRARQF